MTTIADVMRGLEARLLTIPGLRVPGNGSPDQVNPPAAFVEVPPIPNYHTAFRGRSVVQPQVVILVSATLSRIGQMNLAEYADTSGPKSVVAAIRAEPTLGGTVADCVVDNFRPLGLEEVGRIGYFGGVWQLRAWPTP